MRGKFWIGAALSLLLLSSPAQASVDVETTRIGHGVSAWYAANDQVPVVDILLSFDGAGTASDPTGKAGRAVYAAGLLTEGAGNLTSQQFKQALEAEAITLEIEPELDRLNVHIHCLREHAARAGELLALALTAPQLNENDSQRIKGQITSILRQKQESPAYQARRLLSTRAFAGHPYASPTYGTAESIGTLTPQDVRDYLSTYVTRGNVVIAAAGDVDASLLGTVLSPLVDALKANDAGPVAITQTHLQSGGEVLRQSSPVPQTQILFAGPGIARDDKRFYAAYLLNYILGGNALTARLSDEIRQKKGLVYSIGTDLDIREGVALLSGALATRNSTADAALAEVKSVLSTIRDKGVTTEECNDAKSYVVGHFPLQLRDTSATARMLLTMQIHHLGEDYLEKRVGYFNDVRCSDINSLASEMLVPEKFLFAIVGGTGDAGAPAAPIPGARGADAR